jgi:hypothetical protein
MKIFIDFEATDKNPYTAEIITGFFLKEDGSFYRFESQVDKWSLEAEEIHGISLAENALMPKKEEAFSNLLKWLPGEFTFVCYANPQSELGYLLYDDVLLKMNLLNFLGLDRQEQLPIKYDTISVHTMAKEAAKKELFTPLRNKKTNREIFKQEGVYRALFDSSYKAHDAEEDTVALVKIYKELVRLEETGVKALQKDQLSFL